MLDSYLLGCFYVPPRYRSVPTFKEVWWLPPPLCWHKCNMDGASRGNPGYTIVGGVFRNFKALLRGCFVMPLGNQTKFYAEVVAFMISVEITPNKNWFPMWFESDSEILVSEVRSRSMNVPWRLKARWKNCMHPLRVKTYHISQIYKKGNVVADAMANVRFSLNDFTWCYEVTDRAISSYLRNLDGRSEYRLI